MPRSEKNICVLGSTGSIGCNTLSVIDNLLDNGRSLHVKYLTTRSNVELLAKQVERYEPEAVVIEDEQAYKEYKSSGNGSKTEVLFGKDEIASVASDGDFDLAVNSLSGSAGLIPTLAALSSGKSVALANKETLVSAGELVSNELKSSGTFLYPIDSEHSAILQCILGEDISTLERVILTASGGPFLDTPLKEMSTISIDDALKHPNWKMGRKITIDSATMMNKGLEVIEAKWLYDLDSSQIEVIVHPQSIVHSFVEFNDGSIKAQLGVPDMRIPIQYALTYPERIPTEFPRVDFNTIGELKFIKPDFEKFRCLQIAYDALSAGKSYPAVMNSANECAVNFFLEGRIGFLDIPVLIDIEIQRHVPFEISQAEQLTELDAQVRQNLFSSLSVIN